MINGNLNLGDYKEDSIVYFCWNTTDAAGASVTRTVDGTISVYKDNDVAQSTAGITDTEDFDALTGVHNCKIDLSADAFYAVGSDYSVVLSGATIDGQTVNQAIAHFSIEKKSNTDIELVATTAQFKAMTRGKKYKLTASLDFSAEGANVTAECNELDFNGYYIKVQDAAASYSFTINAKKLTGKNNSFVSWFTKNDTGVGVMAVYIYNAVVESMFMDALALATGTLFVTFYDSIIFNLSFNSSSIKYALSAGQRNTFFNPYFAGTQAGTFRAAIVGGTMNIVIDREFLRTELNDDINTIIANIGSLNNLSAAQVNAEMVDVVNVDTISELAVAAPVTTPTMRSALMLVYMALRNETESSPTLVKIKNNAGVTICQSTITEAANLLTRSKFV